MIANETLDGVAIGIFLGVQDGAAQVVFAGNPKNEAIAARSTVALGSEDTGCEVALLFEDGRRDRPLIIGRIVQPGVTEPERPTVDIVRDGDRVVIEARDRIDLRCGKARIILEKDGHITIRGSYLVSHASASNRIRGGSINLN
ncbi:DUF6484 domain-containing protein [uncultured Tateyamaria sp.]|uniref:DUF6484 domain-containing protein n=1 Tax=uncultured Tateyamaria sp. TaxID=455651 RepID=UPI0026029296|nr:DUF6484 domain-containing protein [uncultured Tateyamaria sp.]